MAYVQRKHTWWFALMLLSIATFLTGCNVFDPIDTSLHDRSDLDRITEGNIALESGDFTQALEIFTSAKSEIGQQDSIVRGYAESLAGLAGFRVLSLLSAWQTGIGPFDQAETLFLCRGQISNLDRMKTACTEWRTLQDPERGDRISRGLARTALAIHQILEKYDTNKDKKLSNADYIDFDTTPDWPTLYADLTSGTQTYGSVEDAYLDLVAGLNGRGETWSFISPMTSQKFTGTYTLANRRTIQAIGAFLETLKQANTYYQVNEASFTATLELLDGGTL